DGAACARIAAALGLDRLHSLEAEASLEPWRDGARLLARWRAVVEQTCGVSLDPFTSELAGDFALRLLPAGSPEAEPSAREVTVDPEAEDPPEALEEDVIDVAAYVVEHLALEIDP